MAQLQSRAKSFGIIFSRQTSPGVPWPTAKRARTTFVAAERETEDARDESRALRAIDRRPLGRNVAQRRKMLKGEGSSTSCPGTRNKAAKEGSEAKDEREESEIENARRLDKLPQELWERIFDDLEENDLFPLALSCRYFRQKQKELVERTRQREPGIGKPRRRRLALKANLRLPHPEKGQPASADYLWFCSKEKVSKNFGRQKAELVRYLAAFQGHLPLLQELQAALAKLDWDITRAAGKSSSSSSLFRLLTSLFLSLHHRSARRPTGDLAVAEIPKWAQSRCLHLCRDL